MRSVAWAMGWELWRHYRVFFLLAAAYPPAAAVVLRFLPGGELGEAIALLAVAPSAVAAVLLLAIVTYSLSLRADLAVPAPQFPTRLFTVPARTAALVAWPALYGAMAAALLWLEMALLILRPSGVAAPLAWPALGLAAFTVWMQAAVWWPVGWPLARLVAPALLTVLAFAAPRWGRTPVCRSGSPCPCWRRWCRWATRRPWPGWSGRGAATGSTGRSRGGCGPAR